MIHGEAHVIDGAHARVVLSDAVHFDERRVHESEGARRITADLPSTNRSAAAMLRLGKVRFFMCRSCSATLRDEGGK